MQTRHRFLSVCARTVAVALTTLAFVGVTACSAPRIAGRSEQEQELGTCERFLETAQSYSNTMGDANIPLYLRYFTASLAQYDWLNVALQCPSQFGDATMRSAQAQHFTRLAANHFGFAYAPLTVTKLDTVDSLDLPGEALATIALAEDRAGFAAEVLAGRYDSFTPTSANTSSDAEFVRRLASNATLLTMSDNHKEAAARLTMLSKGAQDIRRKVYDTRMLTTSEVNATDPATGLRTRTPAIVEMDCAREQLQRIDDLPASDIATAQSQSSDALLQLSLLIATHAVTAFGLGYPSADYALFAS